MSNAIETEFSKTHLLTRSKARRAVHRNWQKSSAKARSGVNSAIAEARVLLNDEELKLHVYKKTLQAYLYPISGTTPHQFEVWTATKPAYCYICEGLLWGLARQGKRCPNCGVKCHERCQNLINADCLQKAAAKSSHHGTSDKMQNIIATIGEKMSDREKQNERTFAMIRNVFNIPGERHVKHMNASKQSVLDGTCKWSAKLIVTVVEARGLQAKDKTGTSDPYVTVEVGKTKRRSKTIYNNLNPEWNETYLFECHDSTDRLKIQVWDEDDDLKSVVKQRLLRESDDFLGHALIVIHTLSGDMDCWYNLEKRTEKSAVSGSIHLKISVEIKGEEKCAPYRKQYTCLHENIFHHLLEANGGKVDIPNQRGVEQGWKVYFKPDAQDVIMEFAMRYGIEPMYQAMTHFSCLATAYQSVGIRAIMATLLFNITKFYDEMEKQGSYRNKFEACNFGNEKFLKLLENLLNSLRLDLSMYRKNFPSSGTEMQGELNSCLSLICEIGQFRQKVLGAKCETKAIISNCCKQCMEKTYGYIFENCNEMYADYTDSTSEEPAEDRAEADADSLEYWMKFLTLISQILEEDKGSYAQIFEQNAKINLCSETCEQFWNMFLEDLQKVLSVQMPGHSKYTSTDFMNLQFKIKGIYHEYIKKISGMEERCPAAFYGYFELHTLQWLEDGGKDSLDIMEAAFRRDEKCGFKKNSEHSLFSSSVVDVFTQINQSFSILKKLECSIKDSLDAYLKQFSQNVNSVILIYAKLTENAFSDCGKDVDVTCVLKNNLQETRVLLEQLYHHMGGNELPDAATDVLRGTQGFLNDSLDKLTVGFVKKYEDTLIESCSKLSVQLRAIRGSGTAVAPKASTTATTESNQVLKPLMDVLGDCLRTCSTAAETSVLKRILKELWKTTITSLESVVVLPTGSDELDARADTTKNLTPKQCAVLETALHQIKEFFHASGKGLKQAYLDKSQEMKKLTYTLSLYTQTTDALIKLFVMKQKDQDSADESSIVGEVSVQIDLYTHPGTGEHKVTVKVLEAELKWKDSSRFQPFIEVNMIGPYLASKRRRHSTRTKSGALSPKFDESFTFELSNEASMDVYEVQIIAKDYRFLRDDHIIGVGLLQLQEITKQGSCACWCPLVPHLVFDKTGKTILRILHQRLGDNVATEFVQVKRSTRSQEPE